MTVKISTMAIILAASVGLAACGTTKTERGVTGAGIGAAAGAAVDEPLLGALAGGAAGVFTESDDVDLGEPIWEWD